MIPLFRNLPVGYKKLLVANALFLILVGLVVGRLLSDDRKAKEYLPIPPEENVVLATSTIPKRLLIPTIGVDTGIQAVGRTKDGNMAVPDSYVDVGWYRYGYLPGTAGNAVVAGHLDTGGGDPAVFFDLEKVKIDDRVYVVNGEGEKLEFKVIGMSLYDYNDAPLEAIFGPTEASHLNLITCDGVWDPAKKIYDKRLVVFTELVGVAL